MRSNRCADCGTPIGQQATYCLACRFKGDRNPIAGTERPERVKRALSKAQKGVPEKRRGPEHQSWKGDAVTKSQGRWRARNHNQKPEHCQRCGEAKRLDWHHVDGNPHNNDPANLRALCRRCHQIEDGRHEFVSKVMPSLGGKAAHLR
jgi:hypothetical protein